MDDHTIGKSRYVFTVGSRSMYATPRVFSVTEQRMSPKKTPSQPSQIEFPLDRAFTFLES